jgi:hypothetical protein
LRFPAPGPLKSTPNPVVTPLAGFEISAFACSLLEGVSGLRLGSEITDMAVFPRPTRWSPRWPVLKVVAGSTHAAAALRSLPPSGRHRLSPGAPRSPVQCAVKASPDAPGLSLVVVFLRSRRCSCRRRLQRLTPESTSRASFSLAGFQVTLIGRFWVTAEAGLDTVAFGTLTRQ